MITSCYNWDDLVFEDRHKDYGAYVLRRNYPLYLSVSAMIVIVSVFSCLIVPRLFKEKKDGVNGPTVKRTDYIELTPVPAIHKINRIKTLKSNVSQKAVPKVVKEEIGMVEIKTSDVTYKHEEKPSFPGGLEALYEWLAEHLQYPPIAKRMGIEGRVIVEFMVDIDGRIFNIKIRESSDQIFDDEALRAVLTMPDWTPGFVNGVKTTQTYLLPINFVLS